MRKAQQFRVFTLLLIPGVNLHWENIRNRHRMQAKLWNSNFSYLLWNVSYPLAKSKAPLSRIRGKVMLVSSFLIITSKAAFS